METTTITVDERIARDLAPFDAVAAKIEAIKKEYAGLKINGPADKDGYKMVHAAGQNLKDTRIGAEKLHKELKADALAYGRACDARLKQVVEALKPMEDDFYSQWKAEDTRKEREAAEAKAAAEAAIAARHEARKTSLFAIGLTWNGQNYSSALPDVPAVSEAQVTGLEDGPFDELLEVCTMAVAKAKAEQQRQQEAIAEQARKDKEERERHAAIAAENERKAAEIAAKERAINERVERSRENELLAIGLLPIEHPEIPFHAYTDEQWAMELQRAKAVVAERLQREKVAAERAEEERKAREQREAQDREAREKRIAEEAAQAERDRIEAEAKQRKEEEEERIRRAGDVGALKAVIAHLEAMPWPTGLKSSIAKQTLAKVRANVDASLDNLRGTIGKDLK